MTGRQRNCFSLPVTTVCVLHRGRDTITAPICDPVRHTESLCVSHIHTHTDSLSPSLSFFFTLTLTHTHTHTHTHTLTHAHTHTDRHAYTDTRPLSQTQWEGEKTCSSQERT